MVYLPWPRALSPAFPDRVKSNYAASTRPRARHALAVILRIALSEKPLLTLVVELTQRRAGFRCIAQNL